MIDLFPNKADIVVIGGGVVGCSIAYHLAKAGASPVLLEKNEIASAASGGNSGQISITDREPGTQLDWSLHSLDLYREYEQRCEFVTDVEETGGLTVMKSQDEIDKTMHLVHSHKAAGIEIQMLHGREVLEKEPLINPDSVCGAIWCAREGRLNPMSITYGFADRAAQMGATIHTGTTVTGFETARGQISAVKTNKGTISVGTVIMATAAWTAQLCSRLLLEYPIGYNRASALICQPIPQCIRGPVVPGSFLAGEHIADSWVGIAVTQHKNGSILLGQSNRSMQDYNTGIAYDEPVRIAATFARYFPSLPYLQAIRMWSSVTPFMPDEMPLFGYSGVYRNLFMAAGLKGAFTTAPAAGESAAQIITTGKSIIDCAKYSPARFEKEGMTHAH
jgi:sarcosine oxidase subunit beta